jgi:hypothetical protein
VELQSRAMRLMYGPHAAAESAGQAQPGSALPVDA